MRRIVCYILLLLTGVFAGCQHEEIVSSDKSQNVHEVYAVTEGMSETMTKTYMDGVEMLWSSGDRIAVFYKNTLRKRFDVTPESVGNKSATFQMDENYVIAGNNTSISNNIAYYPFCNVTCKVDGISYVLEDVSLPSVQNYVSNSAGVGTYPMVAVTQNNDDVNYHFRNICGALMFQLQGSGFIRSVSIKGKSDEILAGSAVVTAGYAKDPVLALSSKSESDKMVTIDCGENGVELNAETPISFIFSLPPGVFSGGFTIVVTDIWGGTKEYSTSKANTVQRSKIRRMPSQEYIGIRPPQEGDYIDEYGINHGQGIEIDGVIWAPVNCGYKAATVDSEGFPYGKLYQWGRKYGQDYETEPTTEQATASLLSVFMGSMQENSDVFYIDWAKNTNMHFWNLGTESAPVKTEYDPCPDGWRVPTKKELDDLMDNYTSKSSYNGLSGRWFSGSSEYKDGCPSIFLPFAGYMDVSGVAKNRPRYGYYWTSEKDEMLYMSFSDAQGVKLRSNSGTWGCSVRCVKDDADLVPVESITLSKTSFTLERRDIEVMNAKVSPSQATHTAAFWMSDNEDVATVDSDGRVRAISEGTATITAIAGMKMASCTVTVKQADIILSDYFDEYGVNHGPGVNIDGIVWAPVNCGYHKTDFKYGKLYQWGRKYGQGYNGKFYVDGWESGMYTDGENYTIAEGGVSVLTGNQDSNSDVFYTGISSNAFDWVYPQDDELWDTGADYDPIKTEYDPCPKGWRIPAYYEMQQLTEYHSSWTTNESGQAGYWFSGPYPYTNDSPQVFFPAAGYINVHGVSEMREGYGYYWTSQPFAKSAFCLLFFIDNIYHDHPANRSLGASVRCVQEY